MIRRIVILVFSVLIVLVLVEARFPALDAFTEHEPHPMRAVVAGLALRELGPGDNSVDRILRLDSDNVRAWERRCSAALGPSSAASASDCEHAYELSPSAANLSAVASAEEFDNQPCEAEANYGRALAKDDLSVRKPLVLRDEARAAMACGHPEASLGALRQAEQIDLQGVSAGERDSTPVAESLAADRGYMAVLYDRMNQPEQARRMCTEANPGSPGCSCELTGDALSCSQTTSYTIASR